MFVTIKTLNNKIIRLNIESIVLMDYVSFKQVGHSGFSFDVDDSEFEKIKKLTQRYNANKLKTEDYLDNGMMDEFYKFN